MDTYTLEKFCGNCGKKTIVEEKKGTPIGSDWTCGYCGCNRAHPSFHGLKL